MAKNELYKKGLKAFFKLRKDFLGLNPGISTSFNVFNHTIKPILLYGSEIWGIFNVNNSKIKQSNQILMQLCYKNFTGENLHIKFCKTILGFRITYHVKLILYLSRYLTKKPELSTILLLLISNFLDQLFTASRM
jgi:hypothetical protein